ncbi:unnamed protein product [Merluccius merluccius]
MPLFRLVFVLPRRKVISYYGDSYCRIEAIQDVSTFELSLQFKTSRRSGLLLLAAGMEDYMFLELQNGKLQVRMNMGAGEVTLSSSLGVQLNNLLEHHVSVILQDSKLTMTIDKLFPTYVPVPGADEEELNIDIGVWLGGTGDLDAPFLSNAIPPFRGCMADVKFESHRFDILNSEMKDCHDTKESCSSEFEAGDGEATSFISPDSFISLPTWSGLSGEGRGLEFLMKTTIEDAVLVFHPGRESDFIAVGVVGGFLKGVVDIGKGMQVLDNTQVKLDDDQWHRVRLQVEKTLFEIDVDSQASSLPLDDSESLDLVGNLYLGGIQRKMKDVFHDSGILDRMEEQITSESFIGCFGDIKVNQKDRSLQDALVTKDVHVKCEGEDYDYYDSEATTTAAPVLITYSDSVPNKHHCYPTEGMPEAFRNITTLLEVTPLLVPEGGEAFLDINNLSPTFDLNAVGMRQSQIIFTLKSNPCNGMPKQITSFYQSDLEQGSVLYVSTDSSDQENNVIEHIQFDIHLGLVSKWNNTLLVKILPAPVKISHLNPVEVEAEMELFISQENLQATVNGHMVNPQTVKYVLLKPPTLGSLRLQGSELSEGDTFTEQDIHNHDLTYIVHSAVESVDQFQFRVFVGDEHSPIYTMPITIISDPSADSTVPLLTIENLVVLQGGEDILSKKHLWVQSPSSVDFVYRVIQDPKYGRLIRESPPGQPRFDGGIRVFSNEDLQLDRLIYKHDGSKTDSDDFHFTASDETSVQTDAQSSVNGVFRITIQSKNEHVPVRVVDKSFNVVRNGQRLLTTDVLQFRDDDANFNDTQIIYAHEGILSGQLVSVSNPSQPLFRFTQADLRDKRILFVHHGADRDNFQLQVSDGLHQTTTLMQLHAGEPYLRVENNTMVVMDHGSTKTIDTTLLSADSNMDVRDDGEIAFEVTSPPGDGRIIVSGIEALKFTQEDLKKGVVSYEHNYESLRSKDSFGFTVRSKGYSQEGTFRIKIFKQGYYSEPEVVTNKVLIAYEGEHTVVDQDHLKVEQSDILPSEMVFTIREPARLGHVVMLVNNSDRADAPVLDFIHSFTQDDVDEGRVLYVSASQQGSDVFRIDVTNGFTTVENLEVVVRIVPRLIPLHGHNFTVKEGLGMSITTDILNISHSFYDDANIDFVVEEAPRHGDLRYQDGTLQELTYFTWEEVKLGHVFYMHDSSETTEDSFTLSASAYEIERHSLSVTVGITVKPVNDEPPTLTRNTGLEAGWDHMSPHL